MADSDEVTVIGFAQGFYPPVDCAACPVPIADDAMRTSDARWWHPGCVPPTYPRHFGPSDITPEGTFGLDALLPHGSPSRVELYATLNLSIRSGRPHQREREV